MTLDTNDLPKIAYYIFKVTRECRTTGYVRIAALVSADKQSLELRKYASRLGEGAMFTEGTAGESECIGIVIHSHIMCLITNTTF